MLPRITVLAKLSLLRLPLRLSYHPLHKSLTPTLTFSLHAIFLRRISGRVPIRSHRLANISLARNSIIIRRLPSIIIG